MQEMLHHRVLCLADAVIASKEINEYNGQNENQMTIASVL
jgi:hypothetical protein